MREFRMMTFDDGGFPEELHDEADCRRAVDSGRVVADTEITIYPHQGHTYNRPASGAPILGGLLAPPAPEEPEAIPEDDEADEDAGDAPDEEDGEGDRGDDADAGEESPAQAEVPDPGESAPPASPGRRSEEQAEPVDRPPAPSRRIAPASPANDRPPPAPPWKWIVGGVIGLMLFAALLSSQNRVGAPEPVNSPAPSITLTPEPIDPEAGLERQSFYATREIDLEQSASATHGARKLPRGTALRGVVVPGENGEERWLHVTDGPNTGFYVSTTNLSLSERPALDTSVSGLMEVIGETTIRAEPEDSSPQVPGSRATLVSGQKVRVAGLVDQNWAEVVLTAGGVGYVRVSDLVSPGAVETEGNTAETAGEPVPTPTPTPTSSAESSLHKIYVRNECGRHIRFALYYRAASGWTTNAANYWDFAKLQRSYPTFRNTMLYTNNPEIYVAEVDSRDVQLNTPGIGQRVYYDGNWLTMKRANVTLASDGDYEVVLPCN